MHRTASRWFIRKEDYLQRNPNDNLSSYRYSLTDHLGNVRAMLKRASGA
ncbi:hypothetical protein [Sphingobacterium olei]|nr:hypothetical protein [Sphingobacterium olei]